jgi:hypothetical protein
MLADPFQQLDACPTRHLLIGKDDIDLARSYDALGFLGGGGSKDFKLIGQESGESVEDVGLVINQQQGASSSVRRQLPIVRREQRKVGRRIRRTGHSSFIPHNCDKANQPAVLLDRTKRETPAPV